METPSPNRSLRVVLLIDRYWLWIAAFVVLAPLSLGVYLFFRDPVPVTDWPRNKGALLLVFSWSFALAVIALKADLDAIHADAPDLHPDAARALADRRSALAVVSGFLRWVSTAALVIVGFLALVQREAAPILLDSGFQVIQERITFDFEDWTRVPAGGTSMVRSIKEVKLEKVSIGPATYKIFFGASQRVEVESVTHPTARKTLVGKDRLPALIGLTQGYLFEVDLDYLEPNKEETIRFDSNYIDSFQGQSEEWAGTFVLYPASSVVIRLVFPRTLSARNFRVYERQQNQALDRRLSAGDFIYREDAGKEWEILRPRIGRLYRVVWDW